MGLSAEQRASSLLVFAAGSLPQPALMDKMNHSSAEAEAETIEPLRYLR